MGNIHMGVTNPFMRISFLQNRYFTFRHGFAESNEKGILISNEPVGNQGYSLLSKGRVESQVAAQELLEALGTKAEETLVLSSPLLRAQQTSEIICQTLRCEPFTIAPGLRERSFGVLEGKNIKNELNDLIQLERRGIEKNPHEIESLRSVVNRVSDVIFHQESKFKDRTFVLVSHADPIQITHTLVAQLDPKKYGEVQYPQCSKWSEITLGMTPKFK